MEGTSDDLYEPPIYNVPNIVRIMGNILRTPRGQYSTNFADVFSADQEVSHAYVNGVVAVMVSFLILFLFWAFILFALKVRGEDVGCGAGVPFLSHEGDEEISTDDDEASFLSSLGSNSHTDESEQNSVAQLLNNKDNLNTFSGDETGDVIDPTVSTKNKEGKGKRRDIVNPRERRTRFCFMITCLLALACVPLILVLSFGPMKEALDSSNDLAEITRDIVLQVNTSITRIDEGTVNAMDILESVTLDIGVVCPNVEASELEERIGMDLSQMVDLLNEDFAEIQAASEEKTSYLRMQIERAQDGLRKFESTLSDGEEWMWIVPAVLFAASILVALAMFGTILAWRGNSGRNVQNTMSYVVLPLLMVIVVLCWLIALSASLGTMMGSDMCTAGTASGSPDDTIQQVMEVLKIEPNSTTFQLTESYTNQCTGPAPNQGIEDFKVIVENTMDDLWQQISRVDSIGRSRIIEVCGGDELEGLLLAARNAAKLLTSIRRSTDSTSASISCPRINSLYVTLAHETICTEAASASARGFLFFIILGMSLMIIISLRASWLQTMSEDKVYHDEMDVAENMILDEHEEYLEYISKYKHEWEEYRGFNENDLGSPFNDEEVDSWSSSDSGGSSIYEDEDVEGYHGSLEDEGTMACESDEVTIGSSDAFHVTIVQAGEPVISDPQKKRTQRNAVPSPTVEKAQQAPAPPPPPPPPARNPEYSTLHRVPPSRTKSSSSQPSMRPITTHPPGTSFFERYGIEPGHSARASGRPRSVGPSSPRPYDPPARGPIGLGRLPSSGRTFYKANATEYGEVEIELKSHPSLVSKDDTDTSEIYEC